jgi:diacylglycerol kinase (ATP)
MPTKVILIDNPAAGRKRKTRPEEVRKAIQELQRSGIQVTHCETSGRGHAEALARAAVKDGTDLVIVCGGDGTVNEVVCGMAHSSVPLAVLPGGTANILVRELGLPLDIHRCACLWQTLVPRRVSLGCAGSRYFLLMAGIGFDAQVIANVDGRWKRRFGMAIYILEGIKQALVGPIVPFTLSADTGTYQATFACICKARYYGPVQLVREASLFSNEFQVSCFRSQNRFRYFLYALAVMTGSTRSLSDVSGFAASRIECERVTDDARNVLLQTDGELAGELPQTIRVVPDALTLLVPPSPGLPSA